MRLRIKWKEAALYGCAVECKAWLYINDAMIRTFRYRIALLDQASPEIVAQVKKVMRARLFLDAKETEKILPKHPFSG